jgi:hypothetical protein
VVRIQLPDPVLRDTRYMASEERLVMMLRPHWMRLAARILPVAGLAAFVQFGDIPAWAVDVRDASPILLPATVGVLALWFTARWHWRHLMITDRRLILLTGLVGRRARSWPLGGFCRIEYTRGPLAMLFGYGSITFLPAGRLWGLWLRWVPRPDRVYLTLMDMLYGGMPPAAEDDDYDAETAATAADVE